MQCKEAFILPVISPGMAPYIKRFNTFKASLSFTIMLLKTRSAFLLLLILPGLVMAQQDLSKNYSPLKSQGTLPEIFTQDMKNVVQQDITALNKSREKDKALKSTYYTEANYEIEKIVKSGNALINDEISAYLNKLADILLKDNSKLRQQLHIFALKSPVVNAYSYDKGYIFIDIGLISQVETEAQLAYVLSHEISHYTKKHQILGYVKDKKLDEDRYSGKSYDDKLLEKCQYSKEYESEADLEGFKLFESSNYNYEQAEKAFDVLQYAHLPFELVAFNKSFLETEHFKIPAAYQLKEVSSIKNNSNEDDAKSTHPNTAKRKLAISELIKARNNGGRVNYMMDEKQFLYARDLARFEICRLYLKNRDYANAFYAAYILLQKYPENQYLAEITGKCLYAIALYKKGDLRYNGDSYLPEGIKSHTDIESYPQQVYYLISKMPANEWTFMSLNYTYRNHKKFPESKVLAAISDSLFPLVKQSDWGIVDFVRTNKKEDLAPVEPKDTTGKGSRSKTDLIATIQKENNFRNYDTAYYKEMYTDLFMSDKEFAGKFPASGLKTNEGGGGFRDYTIHSSDTYTSGKKKRSKKQKSDNIRNEVRIEKVLLLEPFYLQVNTTRDDKSIDNVTSDIKQEKLIATVKAAAEQQDFKIVTLDPGLVKASDVDKINDYSVINDWFYEKFDGDDNSSSVPIFNTDDINKLIAKYGTPYVMKTGVITLRGRYRRTWFYSSIIDLKTNKQVYKMYELFGEKDHNDLVNAKVYQAFFELKHEQ